MELRLLGPVEVVDPGRPIDLGGSRPTRLLVALVTATGQRLTLDQLVERCFDDDDRPGDAVSATRTAVRRVRRALGDEVVVTRRGGYELDTGRLEIDVDRFEQLIASGRATADPVAAQTSFRQALELWRGAPFGDLGDLDWLTPDRIRLEELHLVALEGWHDANLRNGTITEIIPSLEATAADNPLRERFHRQLMLALYLADRQADALRVYQKFREELIEAGLKPSAETVQLEQRIAIDDPSLRVTAGTRLLRGYRIEERLGEGAFSIVYRGTQPSVDRPVAIKQIRAELANRPDFIRRFETEAHLVARLEHPHIVPLYDYWREPDSAYLVMRYLRGGNLESRLFDGRWDLDKTLGMVHQVGDALAAAHRAGVVHRDVKPANILLDDDGNAYLADFGIALEAAEAADPSAALSAGSPAYASPEQLQRLPVGPPADVHGLAIATYEALTGRLPFPDEPNKAAMLQRQLHDPIPPVRDSRPDIPTAIDAVLARATAKLPFDRYQSVEEFVAALDEAAGEGPPAGGRASAAGLGSRRTMVVADERNPYKGLRAFDEADVGDFAGRERLVDRLVEVLESSRLVAVVGPSGSGKSSVVRAGLLPALRAGRLPGSARWFITTLIPGPNPFEELETALLRIASQRPSDLLSVLREDDRGIARGVRHAVPEADANVVLVIDQFEELFTLAEPRQCIAFLDALAVAVSEDRSRLRVVLTLRADFYDRPLSHDAIGRLVRDATVAVLPLAPDELEHAIVDPAHSVGAEFEPGLFAEIAADVADQPGALPLLQYALTELYEQRHSGLLTRDAYRALGGVSGALARRAEDLYREANAAEQAAVRRILGRLVSLGEGTEDTRRRALRSELGDDPATAAVIERYGDARLLSFDRDRASREPTVEVAHEALLREWPRLRSWLDEDRDGLRILRHLNTTASEWDAADRPDSELYRGGRLESAEELAATHPEDLRPLERDFVNAAVARREAQAKAERRTDRRLRRLLAGVGLVATLALVAGVFAFVQRERANDNAADAEAQAELARANAEEASVAAESERRTRSEAETRRMIAEAVVNRDENPTLSLLLAREAYNRSSDVQSVSGLLSVLQRTDGYLGFIPASVSTNDSWVGVLGDGTAIVRARDSVDVFDLTRRRQISSTPAPARLRGVGVVATGDSTRFATVSADGDVLTMNEGESEPTTSTPGEGVAYGVGLGPGDQLIVGFEDGSVRTYSDRSLASPRKVGAHPHPVYDVALSPDGRLAASSDSYGNVTLWDLEAGEPRWTWTLSDQEAWIPEAGTILQSVAEDGTPQEVGLILGGPPPPDVEPLTNFSAELRFSPDGSRLYLNSSYVAAADAATGFLDWERRTQANIFQFSLLGDGSLLWGREIIRDGEVVDELSFVPQGARVAATETGRRIVVLANDGLRLWAADGDQLIAEGLDRDDRDIASVSPDGTRLATIEYAGDKRLGAIRRTDDGSRIETPADGGWMLSYTRGGDFMSYYGPDSGEFPGRTIVMRDPETFEQLGSPLPPQTWGAIELSPDRSVVAVGDIFEPFIRIYDARTAELLFTLDEPLPQDAGGIFFLEFSRDGRHVAASALAGVAIWDTTTWEPVRSLTAPEGERYLSVEFTNDAAELAIGLASGGIVRLDLATGQLSSLATATAIPGSVYHVNGLEYSEDGRFLVAAGANGATLVDVSTGQVLGKRFPTEVITASASDGGRFVVTGLGDDLLVWNLDPDSWPDIACRAAGRNLTLEEWQQFGPKDEPYRATCPQWPSAEEL